MAWGGAWNPAFMREGRVFRVDGNFPVLKPSENSVRNLSIFTIVNNVVVQQLVKGEEYIYPPIPSLLLVDGKCCLDSRKTEKSMFELTEFHVMFLLVRETDPNAYFPNSLSIESFRSILRLYSCINEYEIWPRCRRYEASGIKRAGFMILRLRSLYGLQIILSGMQTLSAAVDTRGVCIWPSAIYGSNNGSTIGQRYSYLSRADQA